jgi:hypothetical protein
MEGDSCLKIQMRAKVAGLATEFEWCKGESFGLPLCGSVIWHCTRVGCLIASRRPFDTCDLLSGLHQPGMATASVLEHIAVGFL